MKMVEAYKINDDTTTFESIVIEPACDDFAKHRSVSEAVDPVNSKMCFCNTSTKITEKTMPIDDVEKSHRSSEMIHDDEFVEMLAELTAALDSVVQNLGTIAETRSLHNVEGSDGETLCSSSTKSLSLVHTVAGGAAPLKEVALRAAHDAGTLSTTEFTKRMRELPTPLLGAVTQVPLEASTPTRMHTNTVRLNNLPMSAETYANRMKKSKRRTDHKNLEYERVLSERNRKRAPTPKDRDMIIAQKTVEDRAMMIRKTQATHQYTDLEELQVKVRMQRKNAKRWEAKKKKELDETMKRAIESHAAKALAIAERQERMRQDRHPVRVKAHKNNSQPVINQLRTAPVARIVDRQSPKQSRMQQKTNSQQVRSSPVPTNNDGPAVETFPTTFPNLPSIQYPRTGGFDEKAIAIQATDDKKLAVCREALNRRQARRNFMSMLVKARANQAQANELLALKEVEYTEFDEQYQQINWFPACLPDLRQPSPPSQPKPSPLTIIPQGTDRSSDREMNHWGETNIDIGVAGRIDAVKHRSPRWAYSSSGNGLVTSPRTTLWSSGVYTPQAFEEPMQQCQVALSLNDLDSKLATRPVKVKPTKMWQSSVATVFSELSKSIDAMD